MGNDDDGDGDLIFCLILLHSAFIHSVVHSSREAPFKVQLTESPTPIVSSREAISRLGRIRILLFVVVQLDLTRIPLNTTHDFYYDMDFKENIL